MSVWCDNPNYHRRKGELDYERKGRYGYDIQQYNDYWDDCSKFYREGFDQARREDERRQEMREEQERHERQAEHRRQEARRDEYYRQEEEEYNRQQEEAYYAGMIEPEPQQPTLRKFISLDSPRIAGLSRKRFRHWCRQHKITIKSTP